MGVSNAKELAVHLGHKIEVVQYAEENFAIECRTCNEVLMDFDDGICTRCGSELANGRCSDVTCPFSDCLQSAMNGWSGYPERRDD